MTLIATLGSNRLYGRAVPDASISVRDWWTSRHAASTAATQLQTR